MKSKFRFLRILLLIIMIICIVQIIRLFYLSHKNQLQQDALRNLARPENKVQDHDNETLQISDEDLFQWYLNLYNINSDFVGWLQIEDTSIDSPVVQSADQEFYLNHNFYKEKSNYGCLYVKDIADIETPGTNFIVYGHNMKDGSMFGELDRYENENYYKDHPTIIFDTFDERKYYDIISVFRIKLYDENDDFKYYEFYRADTEEEFSYFYQNLMNRALYNTGVTAEFGDCFITLSTCAYQTDNSRFVVIGKLRKR